MCNVELTQKGILQPHSAITIHTGNAYCLVHITVVVTVEVSPLTPLPLDYLNDGIEASRLLHIRFLLLLVNHPAAAIIAFVVTGCYLLASGELYGGRGCEG